MDIQQTVSIIQRLISGNTYHQSALISRKKRGFTVTFSCGGKFFNGNENSFIVIRDNTPCTLAQAEKILFTRLPIVPK